MYYQSTLFLPYKFEAKVSKLYFFYAFPLTYFFRFTTIPCTIRGLLLTFDADYLLNSYGDYRSHD